MRTSEDSVELQKRKVRIDTLFKNWAIIDSTIAIKKSSSKTTVTTVVSVEDYLMTSQIRLSVTEFTQLVAYTLKKAELFPEVVKYETKTYLRGTIKSRVERVAYRDLVCMLKRWELQPENLFPYLSVQAQYILLATVLLTVASVAAILMAPLFARDKTEPTEIDEVCGRAEIENHTRQEKAERILLFKQTDQRYGYGSLAARDNYPQEFSIRQQHWRERTEKLAEELVALSNDSLEQSEAESKLLAMMAAEETSLQELSIVLSCSTNKPLIHKVVIKLTNALHHSLMVGEINGHDGLIVLLGQSIMKIHTEELLQLAVEDYEISKMIDILFLYDGHVENQQDSIATQVRALRSHFDDFNLLPTHVLEYRYHGSAETICTAIEWIDILQNDLFPTLQSDISTIYQETMGKVLPEEFEKRMNALKQLQETMRTEAVVKSKVMREKNYSLQFIEASTAYEFLKQTVLTALSDTITPFTRYVVLDRMHFLHNWLTTYEPVLDTKVNAIKYHELNALLFLSTLSEIVLPTHLLTISRSEIWNHYTEMAETLIETDAKQHQESMISASYLEALSLLLKGKRQEAENIFSKVRGLSRKTWFEGEREKELLTIAKLRQGITPGMRKPIQSILNNAKPIAGTVITLLATSVVASLAYIYWKGVRTYQGNEPTEKSIEILTQEIVQGLRQRFRKLNLATLAWKTNDSWISPWSMTLSLKVTKSKNLRLLSWLNKNEERVFFNTLLSSPNFTVNARLENDVVTIHIARKSFLVKWKEYIEALSDDQNAAISQREAFHMLGSKLAQVMVGNLSSLFPENNSDESTFINFNEEHDFFGVMKIHFNLIVRSEVMVLLNRYFLNVRIDKNNRFHFTVAPTSFPSRQEFDDLDNEIRKILSTPVSSIEPWREEVDDIQLITADEKERRENTVLAELNRYIEDIFIISDGTQWKKAHTLNDEVCFELKIEEEGYLRLRKSDKAVPITRQLILSILYDNLLNSSMRVTKASLSIDRENQTLTLKAPYQFYQDIIRFYEHPIQYSLRKLDRIYAPVSLKVKDTPNGADLFLFVNEEIICLEEQMSLSAEIFLSCVESSLRNAQCRPKVEGNAIVMSIESSMTATLPNRIEVLKRIKKAIQEEEAVEASSHATSSARVTPIIQDKRRLAGKSSNIPASISPQPSPYIFFLKDYGRYYEKQNIRIVEILSKLEEISKRIDENVEEGNKIDRMLFYIETAKLMEILTNCAVKIAKARAAGKHPETPKWFNIMDLETLDTLRCHIIKTVNMQNHHQFVWHIAQQFLQRLNIERTNSQGKAMKDGVFLINVSSLIEEAFKKCLIDHKRLEPNQVTIKLQDITIKLTELLTASKVSDKESCQEKCVQENISYLSALITYTFQLYEKAKEYYSYVDIINHFGYDVYDIIKNDMRSVRNKTIHFQTEKLSVADVISVIEKLHSALQKRNEYSLNQTACVFSR